MFPECREFLSYSSCWQVFSHFLLAGFFSPNKWLMLIALLDFSLTYLPVFLLKEHLKKRKSERKSKDIKR